MYGTEYPNSYLDIYYPGALEENRPTYIYIHGGGFIFGDKNGGDPISPNADSFMYMLDYIYKKGYNLISVNYCFSPQYRYPIQIIQCLQSLDYLNKHASELHLNMNKIILGGESAGAVISSQIGMLFINKKYLNLFNNVLTQKGYDKLKRLPLNKNQIKVLILQAPPMIINGMNEGTVQLFQCWYGYDDIVDLTYSSLNHIVEYVTSDYYPTFITAGNTDCYPEDALELKNKLQELGVEYSYCYWDKDVEILNHGYMSSFQTSEHAKIALDQSLDFIRSQINKV